MKPVIVVGACALAALAVWSSTYPAHATDVPAAGEAAAKSYEGTGVVQRIDAGNRKITLAHDPIASLGWPKMTMAFRARDAKTLEGLQVGQKVAFRFVQQGRDFVIISVQ